MKEMRDILVVDDEPVILEGISKVCSGDGLSVDMAENGAAALAMLSLRPYRIVVCDIMMPQLDGFQCLEEAARRKLSSLVVMATGFSTLENTVKSLSCGAVDFIPKPFTADELLSVIRRTMRLSAMLGPASSGEPGPQACLVHVAPPQRYYRMGYISWALVEDAGTVLTGVTDLFMRSLGEVSGVSLLPAGREIAQGNSCAEIRSADGMAHGVMCPVSGKVLERNAAAEAGPELLEKDPYFSGWMYRLLPSDLERDLQRLLAGSSGKF